MMFHARPCTLGDRVAFSHSVVDGITAQEYEPTGKASREVGAFVLVFIQRIGGECNMAGPKTDLKGRFTAERREVCHPQNRKLRKKRLLP